MTVRDTETTRQNLTEKEAVTGCTFACICYTVFRIRFSCLQINCQPFYLRQLLKFHPFDWLIKIYLQTEGQSTHHKMVSLQLMPGFRPLLRTYTQKQRNLPLSSSNIVKIARNKQFLWSNISNESFPVFLQ